MLTRSPFLFLYLGLVFATNASPSPLLTYSTYLRDSFTPQAIAADSAGNIYLAGNAIADPATSQTTALVVKLDPHASQYLYVRYLGGSVYDTASSIAVDSAGNAYIAGSTGSPDFPVTGGGHLAAAPTGLAGKRSFVVKLDSNGELVFSDLLGGSSVSAAAAVAVNASGQVVVTGTSISSGFPSTAGAYSIADSTNHPYLIGLDPTGAKLVFSATGIGGSALALDPAGNIYVAGTTTLLDYPTTPGSYQPTFPQFLTCYFLCQVYFQGTTQYVTKVDPTGTKLIFSTAVTGGGNTINQGLAVDAAGNVYLTGIGQAEYPFTVTPPPLPSMAPIFGAMPALPFLSKLDPAGQHLLFSVPVGGMGVQVDSKGAAYVGGNVGYVGNYYLVPNIPALANASTACLPNLTVQKPAYAAQVDAASGNLLGSQLIEGSKLGVTGVALSGSALWIAGATNLPDVPFSPGALTSPPFESNSQPGAYLGAVDFAQPEPDPSAPQIGCIVDSADMAPAGPVAPYQIVTIFGSGLGPAVGVNATDNSTTTLAGVQVTFGSVAAPLLYVSSTQINFAMPAAASGSDSPMMQVSVNGVSSPPRQFEWGSNPSLFVNFPETLANEGEFFALALNQDGSVNAPGNPARRGSVISVFVNGLSPNPGVISSPPQLSSNYGWFVTGVAPLTPFVLQVNLQVPLQLENTFGCDPGQSFCTAGFTISDVNVFSASPQSSNVSGQSLGAMVYVSRTQ